MTGSGGAVRISRLMLFMRIAGFSALRVAGILSRFLAMNGGVILIDRPI